MPVDWYTTSSTYWNATGGTLNRTANSSAQCSNPQHQFYDFEADFDVIITNYGSSQGNWIAFAFRKTNYSDWYNTSGYMVYYRRNGELELYSASGGILNQNDFTGKPLDVWRHLKIVTTGANIKVYIDGELELEHNDGTYTGQYFGFNTLGVQASFDNFSINANPFKDEIYYVRDVDGEVLAEYDGAGNLLAEYVSANGQLVAKINPTGTVDFYLNDHLGSARAMVGSGWSANYYPFGEIASQTGSDEDTHFDFTGHERDRGTGLIYAGARFYDPETGRWVSVDPLADEYPAWSPYNYTLDNPLLFFDPNGMEVIVDQYGYVTSEDEEDPEDNSVYAVINGKRVFIGYRHGIIEVTVILGNLLAKNMADAAKINDPRTFQNLVKTKGDWDLKNLTGQEGRAKSIFAYGTLDENQTTYSFGILAGLQSQDLGNIHYGATGLATGLFTETTLLREAGLGQIEFDYNDPHKGPESIIGRTPTRSPYGDDPRDQNSIRFGFYIQGNNPPSGPIKSSLRSLSTRYSEFRAQQFLKTYPGLRK